MTKVFRLLFGVICIFSAGESLGQQGYIERDSSYVEGKISFDPKKPYQIGFLKGGTGIKEVYQADELTGFGDLKGKTEYRSFEIDYNGSQRVVFLKRISDSEIQVFSLDRQKRIFLFSDRLIELQKPSYKYQITHLVDQCSFEALERLEFNLNAIAAFMRDYDKTGKCKVRNNMELGIVAGYTTSTLNVEANSEYDFISGGYQSTYTGVPIGIYTNIPFWPVRGLNWLVQLQYQQHIYQQQSTMENRVMDVSATASSVQLSGSAFYEYGAGNIRPYVYGGPSLLGYFGAESDMLLVIYNPKDATYDRRQGWLTSSGYSVGINWGAGIRLTSFGKVSLSAEYQGSVISFPENYNILMNNFQIKIGI